MKKLLFTLLSALSLSLTAAAQIPVIIETDMGNDVDDALAMDIAYKAADAGQLRLLGVSCHKLSPTVAQYVSVMNRWYGYAKVPVAMSATPVRNDKYIDYTAIVKNCDERGKPLFRAANRKVEESVEFYRRTLAAQANGSVVIVSLGFATNLSALLASAPDKYSPLTGKELVACKVRLLSMMAGSFGEKIRAEYNIVNDLPAAQTLFEQWPTQIVLNPFEIGKLITYPATSIEKDFTWATHHPLTDAYKCYQKMPYDRPTWDLLSVVYLTNPSMFTFGERGNIRVDDKGFTHFTPSADGRDCVLSATATQRGALLDHIVQVIAKPSRGYNK